MRGLKEIVITMASCRSLLYWIFEFIDRYKFLLNSHVSVWIILPLIELKYILILQSSRLEVTGVASEVSIFYCWSLIELCLFSIPRVDSFKVHQIIIVVINPFQFLGSCRPRCEKCDNLLRLFILRLIQFLSFLFYTP